MPNQIMESEKPAQDHRTFSETATSPRPGAQAIAAGWEFLERLLSSYSGRLLCAMPNGILSLAYMLARIGESSRNLPPSALRTPAHKLLDCISEFGRMDGGWAREESPDWSDCLTTCWAITALENFGWPVPEESYAFVRACERWDGSFAASPLLKQRSAPETALATTVSAVRVLREISPRTEEYLLQGLSTAERSSAAAYVCAEVLDWQSGLASWQLLNSVSRLTASLFPNDADDVANLLRCLLRLRLQRSWPVSADLRSLQESNGSWIGMAAWLDSVSQEEQGPNHLSAALVTATAVSSLLLAEAQPGLYFGSDLPARRFNQEWRR